MNITRRGLVGLLAGVAAAFTVKPPRPPYVLASDNCCFIGLDFHPKPTFIGSALPKNIGRWNGRFYPVTLTQSGWELPGIFSDADLCDFNREDLYRPWRQAQHSGRWPNLAAFARELRLGEHPKHSWAKLRAVGLA